MDQIIHVLLVEDTPIAQLVARRQMVDQGCSVDIAADGFIALDKTTHKIYDLILMDIGLGDGPDGFEVTRQIKAESNINKNTPIVAVSSHNNQEYFDKAIHAGMENYFTKPFTPKDAKIIVDYIKNKMGIFTEPENPSPK